MDRFRDVLIVDHQDAAAARRRAPVWRLSCCAPAQRASPGRRAHRFSFHISSVAACQLLYRLREPNACLVPTPPLLSQRLSFRALSAAMVAQQAVCISGSRAAPAAATTRQQRRRVRSMQARRQTTRCAASIQFAKYQGLGNDFILVGGRNPLEGNPVGHSLCQFLLRPCDLGVSMHAAAVAAARLPTVCIAGVTHCAG